MRVLVGYRRRAVYTLFGAFVTLVRAEHAPAGATTLIIALGILPLLRDFIALMLAVAALTLLGLVINRCFRIHYPVWNPLEPYRIRTRKAPAGHFSGIY